MDNMEPMQPVQNEQIVQPIQPVQPPKAKKEKNPKKIIAIVLAIVIFLVAIFSVGQFFSMQMRITNLENESDYYQQMFNYYNFLIESGQIVLEEGASTSFDDFVGNNNSDYTPDFNQNNQQNVQQDNSQQDNSQQSADPTKWTIAQIVETYKHAAGRTHNNVTSQQVMSLRDGSLQAPGVNSTLLSLTEGVMKTALSNNSGDIKGITGGHQNLVVSDVQSARAYKNGSNIVIEMKMKEQVDKGNGNMYSGSVGHAISVVGDIDSVIGQFSSLGVETDLRDENCTLQYRNPVLKVAINSNGYIVNGTWSYYVDVTLRDLTVSGFGMTVPVQVATSIIDFVVTLNGGFKG
jgi:flagellar basal body-associated protein FliL